MTEKPMDVLRELLASQPVFENAEDGSIDILARREAMDGFAEISPIPDEVTIRPGVLAGRPVEWADPPEPHGVVLYLHGGGYCVGSPRSHRALGAALALAAGTQVALLDYRLAPEHPYPAAVNDAVGAYRELAESHTTTNLAIAGDSAGGGLTLATLLALRDADDPLPATGVMLSPWTDLRCGADTYQTRADVDPMLTQAGLIQMADLYAGNAGRDHPGVSPLLGDLTGLPPLLVQVGDAELLLDDSRELEQRATKADVPVTLEVWDEMIHVFQAFGAILPESGEAIDRIAAHLRKHLR